MEQIIFINEKIVARHNGTVEFLTDRISCIDPYGRALREIAKEPNQSAFILQGENATNEIIGKRLDRTGDEKPIINFNYYTIADAVCTFNPQLVKDEFNLALKMEMRKILEHHPKIGDLADQLASVDIRVDYIIPVTLRLLLYVIEGTPIPPEILPNYLAFAHSFVEAVEAGVYKDRADIENPEEKIPEGMEQRTILSQIVKTEYKDKKML